MCYAGCLALANWFANRSTAGALLYSSRVYLRTRVSNQIWEWCYALTRLLGYHVMFAFLGDNVAACL